MNGKQTDERLPAVFISASNNLLPTRDPDLPPADSLLRALLCGCKDVLLDQDRLLWMSWGRPAC